MSSDSNAQIKEFGLTFDTVSVVVLCDPHGDFELKIGPTELEELEERMGGPIRPNSGLSLNAGLNLSVPRYQLELVVIPGRFEVRSQNPEFSQAIAERMVTFLAAIAEKTNINSWHSAGHNFIVSLSSPNETAVKYIGRKLLNRGLSRKLSQEVIGGSAHIWMAVDESTLLLRFDPQRNSTTTKRFTANANFSVLISEQDEFPKETTTVDRMTKYCRRLHLILESLEI